MIVASYRWLTPPVAARLAALALLVCLGGCTTAGSPLPESCDDSCGARRVAAESLLVPPGALMQPVTVAARAADAAPAAMPPETIAAAPSPRPQAVDGPGPVAPSPPLEATASVESQPAVPSPPLPEPEPDTSVAGPRKAGAIGLGEAVRKALADNATIGIGQGRVDEASAGVGVSRSAFYPQFDVSAGSGYGTVGNYDDTTGDSNAYFNQADTTRAARGELGLSGRQLLYDFGASSNDVSRAGSVKESEAHRLADQSDQVALTVTTAYISILEQREVMSIAGDHVTALTKLLGILNENQKEGNAAVADTKRVRARLIEAQSILADAESQYLTASDRFRRLVHVSPDKLDRIPSLTRRVPSGIEAAIGQANRDNPGVMSADAALSAARFELNSQKASGLPKLQLETDVASKHFMNGDNKTEIDAKVMLALRYKITDGGLQSSQLAQLRGKLLQAEMRLRDTKEEVEASLRQFYHVLATARSKSDSLRSGVADSDKARQLYNEQFAGGKRTLLELLEVQNAYFQSRLAEITNRFDEQRATFGILRNLGVLAKTTVALR